jgi:outer membrane protein
MKPTLSNVVLSAVISAALFVPGLTAAQINLIRDHFERARSFDPTYLAAIAGRDAAQKATEAAEAMLGPKVSLSGTVFRTNRVEESRNIFGQTVDVSRRFDTQNATVQARQPIYRKREALGVDQAIAQESAAENIVLFAEQDLHARLVSSWLEVLSARTLVSTYTDAYLASQEYLAEVDRRRQGGEATVQDLEQARARVVQAEALLEDAKARLQIADQALTLIVGPDQRVPAGVSMAFFSSLPVVFKSEAEVIEKVERSNYEIMSAKFQEEASKLERDKARSDRLPTADAFASVTKGQNDSLSFIKDEQRLGVQVSVPLYTHGAIDASIAQADANFRKLQAQTKATAFRVRNEALSAFNNLRALEIRLRASDRIAEAAVTVLKAQRLGLKAGVSSRGEIAQSMTEMLAAYRDRVLVRREYAVAWLKLQAATGALDFNLLEALQIQMIALQTTERR